MTSSKILDLAKRALKSPRIYHAQWFITRKCNYRCRGCNVWIDQDSNELSTEDVKKGLDILRDIGVLEIVFSGGNPLLRDDIGEILRYASKYFITTIYDNGSIAANKIDELRNADFVAISLDTLDEKKNDYLKGVKGSWKKAMESISILKKEGINVGVSPTISQINLYEIIDFTKYFIEQEIPVWYCLYTYDYPLENRTFSIGQKNDEYEITDLRYLAEVCDTLIKMKMENEYIYITKKTLEAVKHLALTGKRIWRCRALESFLVVDHLGRVSGCHIKEPISSIFELPKILKSPIIDRLRRENQQCVRCNYLCYIFYSVHAGFFGTLDIILDRWKSIKSYLMRGKVQKACLKSHN